MHVIPYIPYISRYTCDSLWQHSATHCNILQHTATRCLYTSGTVLRGWVDEQRQLYAQGQLTSSQEHVRLECTVVRCVVVQCGAVWCSELQCAALCSGPAHLVAATCAVCCSVLKFVAVCGAVCCGVLQRVAACCSVLQCVAVCCFTRRANSPRRCNMCV